MAWSTSDRRSRLPANWRIVREQALERDGYRCVALVREEGRRPRRCTERATDVDHRERGDDHRLENLQSLCEEHHDAKTQAEAGEARSAKRAEIHKRLRPPREEHPAAAYARTHGSEAELEPGLLARRAPRG